MFHFDRLHLTNYLLWEDQEFVFENGVTHIHGDNGSGKSLLFSSLLPLFYDENYLPKSARASLSFYNSHHEYDFTVFNLGKKTNRYEISIDNKEQKTERIADAKSLIEKHWSNNIQESLFTTTISLTGLQRHPLSTGKPASRLDWIHETLAYASLLDSYIVDVDTQIKEAKENNTKYTLLRNQYDNMQVVNKPAESTAALRLDMESVIEDIRKIEKTKNKIEYAINHKIDDKSIKPPKYSYKELKAKLEKLETVIEDLESKKERFLAEKRTKKEFSTLSVQLLGVKKEYKKTCLDIGVKVLEPSKQADILAERVSELKSIIREAETLNEEYEEQTSLRKFLKKHKDTKLRSVVKLEKLKEEINNRRSLNKLVLEAHDSGEEYCLSCGSAFKHSKKDLQRISDEVEADSAKLEKISQELRLHKAREVKLVTRVDISDLQDQITKLTAIRQLASEYQNIKTKLEALPPIQEMDFDKETYEKTLKRKKYFESMLVESKVYRDVKQRMKGVQKNEYFSKPKKELNKLLHSMETKLSSLYNRQKELNNLIITTETNTMLYAKYVKERAALKEQVLGLRKYSRDFKILTTLKKALGRDGFRTRRLESTLELFVDNLNELAPLLWKEPFKFDIETGSRKCDVIIHRNNKVGDAFTLSGSEQRRWQLLAGLAMLRLLPANRRCNTVILDELEANLNMKSRHQMMQDFIPELNKTVPNVIIVSPLSTKELSLKPDISYTVEKRNNKSKLIRS